GQPQIATDQVSETDPTQGTDPNKQALNTIDAVAPTSSVAALPPETAGANIAVSWSGQDDAGGSGVGSYDVYVSADGGQTFTRWLEHTTLTGATYVGVPGTPYA